MALSMKPLADRVIVRAAAAEEKTKSGIIIPDTAKEKPQRGEVVAVGDGKFADSGAYNNAVGQRFHAKCHVGCVGVELRLKT